MSREAAKGWEVADKGEGSGGKGSEVRDKGMGVGDKVAVEMRGGGL
jgi:hypothetical protein